MPNPIEMQQDRLNDLAADIREGRAMQALLTARITKLERELERVRNDLISRGADPAERITASYRLQPTNPPEPMILDAEDVWAEPVIEDTRPDDGRSWTKEDQPGWRFALKLGGAIVVFMGVLGTAIILMLGGVGT